MLLDSPPLHTVFPDFYGSRLASTLDIYLGARPSLHRLHNHKRPPLSGLSQLHTPFQKGLRGRIALPRSIAVQPPYLLGGLGLDSQSKTEAQYSMFQQVTWRRSAFLPSATATM